MATEKLDYTTPELWVIQQDLRDIVTASDPVTPPGTDDIDGDAWTS